MLPDVYKRCCELYVSMCRGGGGVFNEHGYGGGAWCFATVSRYAYLLGEYLTSVT